MPHDVCIVHIEDEFHQMKYLPVRMRQYVQQYLLERAKDDKYPAVTLDITETGGEENAEWIVYDIGGSKAITCRVRYIFSAASTLPGELVEHICDNPHFIIDVLRPTDDRQALQSTAAESIESALKHGGKEDGITIYTACQGGDLDKILSSYPTVGVISKIGVTDLNVLLSRIVINGLNQGARS